jgi:muramidase (phage lysozyme)
MNTPQQQAFLDAIAFSEIGTALLAVSDNGYNVLVGSTPAVPLLFQSYNRHPCIHNQKMNSDAAGRYQFMGRFWDHYKMQLNLQNFGPASQDIWALQLIRECKALDDIEAGHISEALYKCRSRWASLPGANYGQHEQSLGSLLAAFARSGGAITA